MGSDYCCRCAGECSLVCDSDPPDELDVVFSDNPGQTYTAERAISAPDCHCTFTAFYDCDLDDCCWWFCDNVYWLTGWVHLQIIVRLRKVGAIYYLNVGRDLKLLDCDPATTATYEATSGYLWPCDVLDEVVPGTWNPAYTAHVFV